MAKYYSVACDCGGCPVGCIVKQGRQEAEEVYRYVYCCPAHDYIADDHYWPIEFRDGEVEFLWENDL